MAPSKRHTELQNMVATWIGNRSFKMCALPECRAVGYVADFVALVCMLDQYHTKYAGHSGLTKKYATYGLSCLYQEHGDIDRHYVCVFEIKISRADFLNTFGAGKKSPHAQARAFPVGTAHWVVADKGICKPEDMPDFWGLLEPYGTGLTEKKMPILNILPTPTIHSIAFDMLWEQMNFRVSYYDQIRAMAESVHEVRKAIIAGCPIGEIRHRCDIAIKACGGLCEG